MKRVQGSIEPRAGYFLSLAREVAEEAAESGLGRGVGAVIVDPAIEAEITEAAYERGQDDTTANWDEAVLAVAGDARYSRSEAGAPSQAQLHGDMAQNTAIKTYNSDIEGGPELHALMRAVDLIARWRREHDSPDGIPVPTAPPRPSVSEQGQQQPELPARLSAFESHFLYRRRPHLSNPPHSPSSPLKRKHEEPNPESVLTIDVSADPSLHPHHQPLPGPPLSSTASSTSPSNSTTRTIRTRSQGGYLCTDLDIYLSHEPCLCCSMGMLLSRFRAVIFPRRGRMASGGLASEPIVAPFTDELDQAASAGTPPVDENHKRQYYGLHWRKELNWRALGFEFVEDEDGETCDEAQMPVFHA